MQYYGPLGELPNPYAPKRKVFVSYHHGGDQGYYNAFTKFFADTYDVMYDNSLDRAYDSDNADYVRWQIGQHDITGTSCTIVLCGVATHERKYVDWEIKATLDKQHGLIGVWLPTLPLLANNATVKPDRLQDNIDSGYAKWVAWNGLTIEVMKNTIEAAIASPAFLIWNARPLRVRNG
jgi:MTH538 TIR-like domain (DUF1863)